MIFRRPQVRDRILLFWANTGILPYNHLYADISRCRAHGNQWLPHAPGGKPIRTVLRMLDGNHPIRLLYTSHRPASLQSSRTDMNSGSWPASSRIFSCSTCAGSGGCRSQ